MTRVLSLPIYYDKFLGTRLSNRESDVVVIRWQNSRTLELGAEILDITDVYFII